MDLRRQMCLRVRAGELSLSQACREYGITRKTGGKWIRRAEEMGIESMRELSRAPLRVPAKTCVEVEEELLKLKDKYPEWGAKKLCHLLLRDHGLTLQVRTGDRILKRHGLVQARPPMPEMVRFERPACNLLWQMDFKGAPKSLPYVCLSVLDDHSRMSPLFKPVRDKRGKTVFEALWPMFEETGLPEAMLIDNGDCWGSRSERGPTAFEAKLWRLGIRTTHGRPYHPQTQGKVERFHQTALKEIGQSLFDPDVERAQRACEAFRTRYNWVRPHEALGGEVPGKIYAPSTRKRPERVPAAHLPEGAISRKVWDPGCFTYKNVEYRISSGLVGERVELREHEIGMRVYYAGFAIAYLHEL